MTTPAGVRSLTFLAFAAVGVVGFQSNSSDPVLWLVVAIVVIGLVAVFWPKTSRQSAASPPVPAAPIPPPIHQDVLLRAHRALMERLDQGELSATLASMFPIILHSNERLVVGASPVRLGEDRAVRGANQGVSFRVMNGLWLRSSASDVTRRVMPIDHGWLVLTNKRFVFGGQSKTLEFPLSKLTTLETAEDGIGISRTGRERKSYFVGVTSLQLTLSVAHEGRTENVSHRLTGMDLRELVDILTKASPQ